jgi:hypothetical protein
MGCPATRRSLRLGSLRGLEHSRFVGPKSEEQLDIQTLLGAGDPLVGERTALVSQLRAIAFGNAAIAVPQPRMVCARRGAWASPRIETT